MPSATHKNIDHPLWMFDYRMARGLVFVNRAGEWIRSQTPAKHLITLSEYRGLVENEMTRSVATGEVLRPLISQHKKTKKRQRFASIQAAIKYGYTLKGITDCIHGTALTHYDCTWRQVV